MSRATGRLQCLCRRNRKRPIYFGFLPIDRRFHSNRKSLTPPIARLQGNIEMSADVTGESAFRCALLVRAPASPPFSLYFHAFPGFPQLAFSGETDLQWAQMRP